MSTQCYDDCILDKNHEGDCNRARYIDLTEKTSNIDERIELPEKFFKLLEEAVNGLYKKVCDENEQLVTYHKENRIPTAVFRPAYELQTIRTGDAGMLMQWFRKGFRIEGSDD